jgi:hypothetical protein
MFLDKNWTDITKKTRSKIAVPPYSSFKMWNTKHTDDTGYYDFVCYEQFV